MLIRIFSIFLLIATVASAQEVPRPLAKAFLAIEKQDWQRALYLAQKDGAVARDIIEWHLHRAKAGTAKGAIDFLARNPDWPGLPYLKKRSENSFLAAPIDIIEPFFAQNPPQTSQGGLAYAAALKAAQKHELARDVIRNAWASYDMPTLVQDVYVSSYGKEIKDMTSTRLYELLWRQKDKQAEALYPLLNRADKALAKARIALMRGDSGVDTLLSQLSSEQKTDALLSHARFKWRLSKRKRKSAVKMMLVASETKEALGRPDVWGDDRRNIARDLVRDKSYQTAYKLASNHFMNSGHIYADLEWLSGYISLRYLKKPKTAQLHFEKFMFAVDTPISLGRAYYWLARAYQDQGQNEKARKAFKEGAVYQTSFYGLLSAEEISVPFKYDFYPPKALPNWRSAPFLKSSVFKAAILLFASGQDALGERFITHLVETLPDKQILQMTHFLEEFDRPHVLVMVGKRKASQGMSFPRSYFALHPMIEENYPVPAQLSLAIARRESEFDPRVVSPVGASGIMQVMPRTAKEMAGKIGLRYDQNRMVSDWKYNARLGTVYLQELSERFSANPVLVSVAYNAGPTRAENWSKLLGDPRSSKVDIIDWIEMIPFAETRNYVMRTIESLPIYRARLGQDPLPVPFSKSLKGSGF
jgi:soluble lytic murein transglycosylase